MRRISTYLAPFMAGTEGEACSPTYAAGQQWWPGGIIS